jgi:hypothetical protein
MHCESLSGEEVERLRSIVDSLGQQRAIAILKITKNVLARGLARLPMVPANAQLLRLKIEAYTLASDARTEAGASGTVP